MRYGRSQEKIHQWVSLLVGRVTPSGIGPRFVLTGTMMTLAVAFASAEHQPVSTILAWILCSAAVLLLVALHQATNSKFGKVSESLESIGLGELSGRVETILEGESGRVVESVRQMNRDLAGVVEQVRSSSERIAVAAREMAAGVTTCRSGPRNKPRLWSRSPPRWRNWPPPSNTTPSTARRRPS